MQKFADQSLFVYLCTEGQGGVIAFRSCVHRSLVFTVGLRRELYVRLGLGGRPFPQRAPYFAMGRHEIRLGVMRRIAT